MAQNFTTVHKKIDRILGQLSTLEAKRMSDARRSDAQINLLARLVAAVEQRTADISFMTEKALDAARKSEERTAEILAEMRKH